jgi:CubicO group peptidase (beta-lactamase class C family)
MARLRQASLTLLPLWLLILVFVPLVHPKDLGTATPESVGMSSKRLARIDGLFQVYIDEQRIKGAVALIGRRNKVVYHTAFGEMDDGQPIRKDTIFRICSMTKPITAVAAMTLWEKGLFTLSDPISRFIPEFEGVKVLVEDEAEEEGYKLVSPRRPITVRDLLAHTSGISYGLQARPHISQCYLDENVPDGLSVTDGLLSDGIKRLARCPLLFHPGEGWEYGLNLDVLGYIVEVVSGMALDDYLETSLFGPLEMNDTSFFLWGEKKSRLAALFEPAETGGMRKLERKVVKKGWRGETKSRIYDPFYPYEGPRTYLSGGGGLVSTAVDYMRFCQMLLNGGELDGVRVLSPTTIDLMTGNHIGNHPMAGSPAGWRWGLGFGVLVNRDAGGVPLPNGSYSWGGLYFTRFYVDPKHEVIAMFFSQLYPSNQVRDLEAKFWALSQAAIIE